LNSEYGLKGHLEMIYPEEMEGNYNVGPFLESKHYQSIYGDDNSIIKKESFPDFEFEK